MIGTTSLRSTMIPSMNAGAVGTVVEPLYGMIWRTAMMSRTNVSTPTRNVIRRSAEVASAIASRPHAELAHFLFEAADRVVEQRDGVAHLRGGGAIAVGDDAHLLHRRDDLLALRR